jgi:TPR repeat protein
MGYYYYYAGEYQRAIPWFEKSIEKLDPYGHFILGLCFENGFGVEPNAEKAFHLYEEGAKLGWVYAMENLCRILHSRGEDIRAIEWGARAVEGGLKTPTFFTIILREMGAEEKRNTQLRYAIGKALFFHVYGSRKWEKEKGKVGDFGLYCMQWFYHVAEFTTSQIVCLLLVCKTFGVPKDLFKLIAGELLENRHLRWQDVE